MLWIEEHPEDTCAPKSLSLCYQCLKVHIRPSFFQFESIDLPCVALSKSIYFGEGFFFN